MVPNSVDDMTAGYKARTATVMLANEGDAEFNGHERTRM